MAAAVAIEVRLATKFGRRRRPVFESSIRALFKVGDERCVGPVEDRRDVGHFVGERFVVIPAVVGDLDETDTGINQPASEQAALTE